MQITDSPTPRKKKYCQIEIDADYWTFKMDRTVFKKKQGILLRLKVQGLVVVSD